jgi:aspartyl-tRNA(Asn)/glutamyl-tRNA(Gln) amidotransferase subunit B
MPEPDLPPLVLSPTSIEDIRASLPALPDAVRQRFLTEYQLSSYDTEILINEPGAVQFFDASLHDEGKGKVIPKFMASWLTTYLFGILHNQGKSFLDSSLTITPTQFASIVSLVNEGKVSKSNGKKVLTLIVEEGDSRSALEIVEEKGWALLEDDQALTDLIKGVLASNPESVARFQKGGSNEKSVLKNLTGQVIRASNGKAAAVKVQSLLESLLRSTKKE